MDSNFDDIIDDRQFLYNQMNRWISFVLLANTKERERYDPAFIKSNKSFEHVLSTTRI